MDFVVFESIGYGRQSDLLFPILPSTIIKL